MNVKGMCLFLHVILSVMCSCCFGATERTNEINCQRGNDTLMPSKITCSIDHDEMTCSWLLGIQYNSSSAIDTSCKYIRSDESVQMYYASHIPKSNACQLWEPCPNQRPTSCTWHYTLDSNLFDVMVITNNTESKTCTGPSIGYFIIKYLPENEPVKSVGHIDHRYVRYNSEGTQTDIAKPSLVPTYYPVQTFTATILVMAAAAAVYGCVLIVTRCRILRQNQGNCPDCATGREYKRELKKISSEKHIHSRRLSGYTGSWTECIKWQCVWLASNLLKENVLPTDSELQSICGIFGKRSKTLTNVCANICETIQGKLKNVTKVWPAYTLSSDKICFVVESDTCITLSDIKDCGFSIHLINSHIQLEKESQIVMLREKEILELCYDMYGHEKFKMLKQIISENAEKLMNKHNCINAITPGIVKSVGYLTSGQHKLIETPCISIYIDKKVRNLIPLEEEPLPTSIDSFPTDVLVGKFEFFGKGPNDYHETIKIGCGIHAGLRNDNGDTIGGTLGAFVKHRTFGLCCITSAHVVLSRKELQSTMMRSYVEFQEQETKMVFQSFGEQSKTFGEVVAASYTEGGHRAPGVEVALIKVQSRKPTSGSFPSTGNGLDEPFVFDSGNVIDANLLEPMTEVYKFGMATGPTTGYLGLQGAAVRVRSNQMYDSNFGVRLYNQLEISPKDNSFFAMIGDSGALVFIGHPECAAAIGIVEGGLSNGKTLVTPIIGVLEALRCPLYLNRFDQDRDSDIDVQCPESAESTNDEEDMDFS